MISDNPPKVCVSKATCKQGVELDKEPTVLSDSKNPALKCNAPWPPLLRTIPVTSCSLKCGPPALSVRSESPGVPAKIWIP